MSKPKVWTRESANYLIEARINLAFTQEELAERAMIDVRVIKKAEAAQNIALSSIRAIAKVIGVEPGVLRRGNAREVERPGMALARSETLTGARPTELGPFLGVEHRPPAGMPPSGVTLVGKWIDTYRYADVPGDRGEHREIVSIETHLGEIVAGSVVEEGYPGRMWRLDGWFKHDILMMSYYPVEGSLWTGHGAYVLRLNAEGFFEGRSLGHDFHLKGKGSLAKHRMVRHG